MTDPDKNEYQTKLVAIEDMFGMVKNYIKNSKTKPLTKRQLQHIVSLIDHRNARARLQGYSDGKKAAEKDRKELRDSLLMTFQRLGNANAQMAIIFTRLLEKI